MRSLPQTVRNHNSCQPLFRPTTSSNISSNENRISCNVEGRVLLDLLHLQEKKVYHKSSRHDSDKNSEEHNHQDLESEEQEITGRLYSLGLFIKRCGMFNNDASRAKSFYSHASERSTAAKSSAVYRNGAETGDSKKRKRNRGSGAGSTGDAGGLSAVAFGIFLDSPKIDVAHSGVACCSSSGDKNVDEGLLLTALCRILGVTTARRKDEVNTSEDNERRGAFRRSDRLICAAANVVSSLCDHAKDGMTVFSSRSAFQCASVEAEMIGSISVYLLDALCDTICDFYHSIVTGQCDGEEVFLGLTACLRASASIVTLVEARLYRSKKTLTSLRDVAWLTLNCNMGLPLPLGLIEAESVQKEAIILLASLPLTGTSHGTSLSKQWLKSVSEGLLLLRWSINDFFPVSTANLPEANLNSGNCPELLKVHEKWKSSVIDVDQQGIDTLKIHRANAFLARVQCLTQYLHSLLTMEGYSLHHAAPTTLASSAFILPFDCLLDVSELLLLFPLAALTRHRSTKARLRSSPVEQGFLSPNEAMSISVDIRLCGHTLFDLSVESCRGGSGALGRARRIVGISVSNLQSSCSTSLNSVVDPTSKSLQRNTGAGWLYHSVPLRIKSIRTFHVVAVSLGSGLLSSTRTSKSICRSLVLLGGCLLEQLRENSAETQTNFSQELNYGIDDDWGTIEDRAKLLETSFVALAACLATFGGLIPTDTRYTIDSIINRCLSTLYLLGGCSIFAYSHVKLSLLQLGINCVSVPWGDGGCCTMIETVRTVALMLRNDLDMSVSSMALSALCVCDALVTPRSPPILVPKRRDEIDEVGKISFTGSALLQGMRVTRNELLASDRKMKSQDTNDNTPLKKTIARADTELSPMESIFSDEPKSSDMDKQTVEKTMKPNQDEQKLVTTLEVTRTLKEPIGKIVSEGNSDETPHESVINCDDKIIAAVGSQHEKLTANKKKSKKRKKKKSKNKNNSGSNLYPNLGDCNVGASSQEDKVELINYKIGNGGYVGCKDSDTLSAEGDTQKNSSEKQVSDLSKLKYEEAPHVVGAGAGAGADNNVDDEFDDIPDIVDTEPDEEDQTQDS